MYKEAETKEREIINILKTLITKNGYYTIEALLEEAYDEVRDD